MSDILKKKLERERKAREYLETEIENKSREVFKSFEYSQKIINSLPELLVVCNKEGDIKMSNLPFDKFIGKKGNNTNILSHFNNQEIFDKDTCEGKIKDTPFIAEKRRFDKDDWIILFKDMKSFYDKEKSKKKLQDQMMRNAYAEGITANAISVLHNIGNILTPISIKSNPTFWKKDYELLNTVLKSIKSFKGEEKDKQKLLDIFLQKNEEAYLKVMDNFKFIYKNSLHIVEIIQSQQKYAQKEQIKSEISFKELLDDVLLIQEDLIQKKNIKIRTFIHDFNLNIEKVGLHQSLSNFIVNSIDSFKDTQRDEYFIEINSCLDINTNEYIIEIKDNGIGIEKDNLNKIFNFGFSTKQRSSGFGLHSCVNFIKKNNGSVEVSSMGHNKGTTFVIRFKINK